MFLNSLAPYRNAIVKVDKYTDTKRAAYALTCCVSQILNKKDFTGPIGENPLKMEAEILETEYKKHQDVAVYEKEQKRKYVTWLSKWISLHKSSPETHMRVLKMMKKITA